MMNWNSNDTKYIIKRIILYFIFIGIVFFAGQRCVKANIFTYSLWNGSNETATESMPYQTRTYNLPNVGNGVGPGTIIYNVAVFGDMPVFALQSVYVGNSVDTFVCDIGNNLSYWDSDKMTSTYTIKCTVNNRNGPMTYIKYIMTGSNNSQTKIQLNKYMSYVTDDTDYSSIITAQQQAIQQQIQAGNTNTTAITNAINTATQNEINAINNQTQAIEDQTQSINDMNDWLQQDHDPLIDTEFIDVFDDLWTTQDDDVIRQFIMIPFNLLVLIYNSLTANSCSAVQLGALYNVTLSLPCINIKTLIGQSLYNTIDIIFAAGLLFGLIRFVKHVFNKIFTLSSTITDDCGVEVFK